MNQPESKSDHKNLIKIFPMTLWLIVATAFLAGFLLGCFDGKYDVRKDAIQHGYMQHNPTTGKVEWK